MAIHRQTLSKRFSDYRRNASTRGLVFNLDKEQFNAITQETCCYCGAEDYIGVDRIDSGKGYTEGNIQPCCTMCNKMKSDFGEDAWLAHIARIQAFQAKKGA